MGSVQSRQTAAAETEPLVMEVTGRCLSKSTIWSPQLWSEILERPPQDCGEDAFIAHRKMIAVADGVGGWASRGVSSKEFSERLMKEARSLFVSAQTLHPLDLVEDASAIVRRHVQYGSTTCCAAMLTRSTIFTRAESGKTLPPSEPTPPMKGSSEELVSNLYVANIGDSGLMVVRDGAIVFTSKETNHGFNFPKQIACSGGGNDSMANDGWSGVFRVRPRDVVVAATDGVWDNLKASSAAAIVAKHLSRCSEEAAESRCGAEIAAEIVRAAAANGTGRSLIPWNIKNRYFGMVGGKPDDTTVVVGVIKTSGYPLAKENEGRS